MKILLVSATEKEVAPLVEQFESIGDDRFHFTEHEIHLLVTGVGLMATAFDLGRRLVQEDYDLALNLGICGALDRKLELGELVLISSDRAMEEGAEDGDKWISLEEMGLRTSEQFPYKNSVLSMRLPQSLKGKIKLKECRAISVNRVLGSQDSIQKVREHFPAEVVSMEGAAFYYACRMQKLDCLQIRAVSNYVENRNKEAWEIDKALRNLATVIPKILEHV